MEKVGNIKKCATYLAMADTKLKDFDNKSAICYFNQAVGEIEKCTEEERLALKTEINEARGNLYDLEQEEQKLGISFSTISVTELRQSYESIDP